MSTPTFRTRVESLVRVQALIAGTQQHFPSRSFTLRNVTFTTASLVQELQSLVDAMQKVNAAVTSLQDLRSALDATEAKVAPVVRDLQRFLRSAFGTNTQTLADFGMQAPKARKPLTAEASLAAVAKLRATRQARGTTSRKQKLAVKGNVTGVVVTPVTEPHASSTQTASNASPAPTPAPPK